MNDYDSPRTSGYLEEAAALLRKAAQTNEGVNARFDPSLNKGRERIARLFAELAAIELGVIPASLAKDLIDRIGGAS